MSKSHRPSHFSLPTSHFGFTLIETIIYSALVSLIIGAVIFSLYQLITGNEKLGAKIAAEEEANFILRKITWVLTGINSINSPASGATSTALSINKEGYSLNPVIFDLNDNYIRIKKGSSEPVSLNSSNSKISNLIFERIPQSGGSPEAIKTTMKINQVQHQLTIYLRK